MIESRNPSTMRGDWVAVADVSFTVQSAPVTGFLWLHGSAAALARRNA